MNINSNQFFLIYSIFFFFAFIERLTNTFFKKDIKPTMSLYYRWTFPLLLFCYLFIILMSILEYFFVTESVNLYFTIFGFIVYCLGVTLRRLTISHLSDNWSVHIELKYNHKLVQDKIYGLLKHPYYLAVIFELIGVCVVSNSFNSLILVFVVQTPVLLLRINLEEEILTRNFGDIYKNFKPKLF